MKRHSLRFPVLPVVLVLFGACGDGSTGPKIPESLEVTPGTTTLTAVGLTQQFSASALNKKGKAMTGVPITWTSSNPGVASITSTGLATGLRKGTTSVVASAEGVSSSATLVVNPLPAILNKLAGDEQTGPLSQTLPELLQLEVLDSEGNVIGGVPVTFGILSGGGSVSPTSGTTDLQGRVTTSWSLGCTAESPQRLRALAGTESVEFLATGDLDAPAICQESVPDGRATFGYSQQLEAVGGSPGGLTWEVEAGQLPFGLELSTLGLLGGTPTDIGDFAFRVLVRDGTGATAGRDFFLRICEAPLALAPGESVSVDPSGTDGCGFFLPSGEAGDRYRFGVLWATSNPADTASLPLVTVSIQKRLAAGLAPPALGGEARDRGPLPSAMPGLAGVRQALPSEFLPQFLAAIEAELATEAYHQQLRASELELLQGLGPGLRLLPDVGNRLRAPGAPEPAPEKLSLYPNNGSRCGNTARVTAIKVAENDHIVMYQDSAQATVDSLTVTAGMAEKMLDYYRDFGKAVIDTYFGGVTDVNGDGRVVVFVTPVVESAVAYVWSGDFLTTAECASSNQMELVRFRASSVRGLLSGNFQPLGTLVHEVKHLSSLYNGISRFRASGGLYAYHPGWVEEGTATMAGEISSRIAWAAHGGPAVGAYVTKADKVVNEDTYYMLISWGRGMFYLSSQPNGTVGVPTGAQERHSIYGSGWHFHRWLGDAYGNASDPLADGALFTLLNDSLSATGSSGIKDVTGKTWQELLDEYATAIMLNGTGAPDPARAFTSYDLPDVTAGLYNTIQPPGLYPWPVNVSGETLTAPFSPAVNIGPIGPSGIRVFDLTSDGSGIGVEVEVRTTREPLRLVVVRVN